MIYAKWGNNNELEAFGIHRGSPEEITFLNQKRCFPSTDAFGQGVWPDTWYDLEQGILYPVARGPKIQSFLPILASDSSLAVIDEPAVKPSFTKKPLVRGLFVWGICLVLSLFCAFAAVNLQPSSFGASMVLGAFFPAWCVASVIALCLWLAFKSILLLHKSQVWLWNWIFVVKASPSHQPKT